ncbi:hypothetical protein HYPSUDRAFT_54638 [Hypholoma sublateritium FD-334 SS-4]|uniref:Uncharacterized protein n=1 Tax=Hypholoma sublateritium (strain FD-334 SS-4) TaxID=945553 RepID=A0A0D2NW13_HYPSF|nr:hypothetical protein HYPSUDRAFT_54638 [Hypholoma sublateritium FD-334 SS-4]
MRPRNYRLRRSDSQRAGFRPRSQGYSRKLVTVIRLAKLTPETMFSKISQSCAPVKSSLAMLLPNGKHSSACCSVMFPADATRVDDASYLKVSAPSSNSEALELAKGASALLAALLEVYLDLAESLQPRDEVVVKHAEVCGAGVTLGVDNVRRHEAKAKKVRVPRKPRVEQPSGTGVQWGMAARMRGGTRLERRPRMASTRKSGGSGQLRTEDGVMEISWVPSGSAGKAGDNGKGIPKASCMPSCCPSLQAPCRLGNQESRKHL